MKFLKLIFLVIVASSSTPILAHRIIPMFYDKQSNKFLGLFVHKTGTLDEWSMIYYRGKMLHIKNNFRNMLGELYDKFQFEENLMFDLGERPNTSFWPAKNFISAESVNQFADTLRRYDDNSDIDNFIWLDLDDLARDDSSKQRSFMLQGKKQLITDPDLGFAYHFAQQWKGDSYIKLQKSKYVDLMQSKPEQKVTLQIGQSTSMPLTRETEIPQQGSQKKPETARPQVPQYPRIARVKYPQGIKDEHKFFYDAYYGDLEALKNNIEIAKQAGSLAFQKLWSGVQQTALTNTLNNSVGPEIIEILLKNGVDPNLKNGIDKSPLRVAIERKLPRDTIDLLLQFGADPKEIVKIANYQGGVQEQSLIDLEGRLEVKNLLKDY